MSEQGKIPDDFHLHEVLAQASGVDIVEETRGATRRRAMVFEALRGASQTFQEWNDQRPFEVVDATPMVEFPRDWSSKHGRYCRFHAAAEGTYGVLRARREF